MSIEALVTFSDPYNQCQVSQRRIRPNWCLLWPTTPVFKKKKWNQRWKTWRLHTACAALSKCSTDAAVQLIQNGNVNTMGFCFVLFFCQNILCGLRVRIVFIWLKREWHVLATCQLTILTRVMMNEAPGLNTTADILLLGDTLGFWVFRTFGWHHTRSMERHYFSSRFFFLNTWVLCNKRLQLYWHSLPSLNYVDYKMSLEPSMT